MTPPDEILTLDDVAKLTRYKKSYLYQIYNSFRDYGVRILKPAPNARPRFYKSDILKMLEAQK